MFYRNQKKRKYLVPGAVVTPMALESNFCATVKFQIEVDQLKNMNDPNNPDYDESEAFYFES